MSSRNNDVRYSFKSVIRKTDHNSNQKSWTPKTYHMGEYWTFIHVSPHKVEGHYKGFSEIFSFWGNKKNGLEEFSNPDLHSSVYRDVGRIFRGEIRTH